MNQDGDDDDDADGIVYVRVCVVDKK